MIVFAASSNTSEFLKGMRQGVTVDNDSMILEDDAIGCLKWLGNVAAKLDAARQGIGSEADPPRFGMCLRKQFRAGCRLFFMRVNQGLSLHLDQFLGRAPPIRLPSGQRNRARGEGVRR